MSVEFISGKDHYDKVIERVASVKKSLWIGAADIKDLHVKSGNGTKPFLGVLADLLKRGVEIRLIHAKEPAAAFREDFDRYPILKIGLERMLCPRVHFKMLIFDFETAYIGSANLTGADIGMKSSNRRNFEAGILQINGQLAHYIAKNEEPFNWTKSHLNWYLQAFYYLNQWHFGIQYQSNMSSAGNFINGVWENSKNAYTAIVGWGNSSWNFQAQIANLFRWNWNSGSSVMKRKNYEFVQSTFNTNNHCFIYVSATYTFGFGKKIKVGNEASQMSGAGNAILK